LSSNSMTDYVEAFRANLPNGVTYDSTIDRYFFNGRRFLNEWSVIQYRKYLRKTPTLGDLSANGIAPNLVLDFSNQFYGEF